MNNLTEGIQIASEVFKWISLGLVALCILLYPLAIARIDEISFLCLTLAVFGAGTIALVMFLLFSPVLAYVSIALPIIAAILYVIFNIVDKEASTAVKTLDWIGMAISGVSVFFSYSGFIAWENFRWTGFFIGVIGDRVATVQTAVWAAFLFIFYGFFKPKVAVILTQLILAGACLIMLIARIIASRELKSI